MGRILCLLATALLAGCSAAEQADRASLATPAEPQQAQLEWRESYPPSGPRLVFGVDRLEIRRLGWSVDVYIQNTTDIPFAFPRSGPQAFGLMLFHNDDLDELSRASK